MDSTVRVTDEAGSRNRLGRSLARPLVGRRLLQVAFLSLLVGCGKGGPLGGGQKKGLSRPKDPDPPPASAPAAVAAAEPARPAAGGNSRPRAGQPGPNLAEGRTGVQLECAGPVQVTQFFLRRHPGGEGRPTRLVLTTSPQDEGLEFPAVYFQAELPAEEALELVGHSVKGRMFVQPDANGPVFHSPGGGVELQFNNADSDVVEGEIFESQMTSTEGAKRVLVSGTFIASTRESTKRRVRQPDSKKEEF